MDLVLSSGFLAFARHCGVLAAVEEADLTIDAVVGTSSGALVGALWCAGLTAQEVAAELSVRTPWSLMRASRRPWTGLFSLAPAIDEIQQWLPPTFEELTVPLAAGVATGGEARMVTSGTLADAVMASCSIPYVFESVRREGVVLQDGGAIDRVGIAGWRAWRGDRPVLVHEVERSHGPAATIEDGLAVVRTPRSGAKLWDLGDFAAQMAEAQAAARAVIEGL
jgi:predicted acylesterase/phospholipase RssA